MQDALADVADHSGHPGHPEPAGITDDARVAAVLAVLRGANIDDTARQWSIDATLLQRWVGAFVEAGTAKVNNRPDEHAARHRDRFLAAFSYEMRTPLTMALGYVGMLDDAPASRVLETSRRIEEALGDLADRVADAELLVRAALGGLEVSTSPAPVRDLVAGLEGLDADAVRGKGPDLEVHVDPVLFARVLRDLWEAAALDPAPRSRRLMVTVVGPWVELRILRDADPIDIPLLQALFEPFESDHRDIGVTTGLYLARALIVAHGGTLGVDQDDSGAAFWVRIPHRPDRDEPQGPPLRSTQVAPIQ